MLCLIKRIESVDMNQTFIADVIDLGWHDSRLLLAFHYCSRGLNPCVKLAIYCLAMSRYGNIVHLLYCCHACSADGNPST